MDLDTRKKTLAIPGLTLLVVAVILLNIPVIRDIIVFAYLSFVPGFVILKTFKLKELGLLKAFLITVGLSLSASMFVGLLVNELYVILGLSTPLSIVPLTAAMSTFTLVVFFVGYERGSSMDFVSLEGILEAIRSYLPLALVLVFLPILSIVGALYASIPIMTFLCLAIAVLCVLSVASNKLIPSKSYPFLIFSISISILLLNLLLSKYITGDDANLEYYVFKVTQTRGYWGPIDAVTHYWAAFNFNSMLSITLLPTVYSVLMSLQNKMHFKILYSFIFSLVPVTLYAIYKNETGKLIGLLSTFFFVFSLNAFFGESTGVNRQIVGEFFLMLSILLWLDKTLPVREKRVLLIIFGVSTAVSHYSVAAIYIVFVSLVVVLSSLKSKFDDTFNVSTVLAIFGITFLWYAFGPGSVLTSIINTTQAAFAELTGFQQGLQASGNTGVVYGLPKAFTVASWINLAVSGIVTLSLLIGVIAVILQSGRMGISNKHKLMTIFGAIMFAFSFLFPALAATLNFTRFYAMALLFLSPCFAIGTLSFLKITRSILRKRNENQKNIIAILNKGRRTALLLIAVLLSAYFLSQSGFINYATRGAIHSQTFDFYEIETSSDPETEVQFYGSYIHDQDAFGADWLSKHSSDPSIVYSDWRSGVRVLISEGLIPCDMIPPLTNTTKPEQSSFVYLDSLNVVKGIIPTSTGLFNTSEISASLNECNLIYSNGNSEVWSTPVTGG